MAEVKSFRWKGPGVLHLKRLDGSLAVIPPYEPGIIEHGCIVNVAKYKDLDQDRIASLITAGAAEAVRWIEEAVGMLRPDAKPEESLTLGDAQRSEAEFARTGLVAFENNVTEMTAKLGEQMSPTEREKAAHELRKMGPQGPIVNLGGDKPAFAKAGPDLAGAGA
jgi:hypothetical protein